MQIVKLTSDPVVIRPNFRGAYAAGTGYNYGDSVSYNGSSYVAIATTTGNLPTNATYWQQLASKGDTGNTGSTGATGATGPAGSNGANGQGVPVGGATGQVLTKNSATDYDTGWAPAGGGGSTIVFAHDFTATQAANYAITGLDLATDKVYYLDLYFPFASGMVCHVNINGATAENPGNFRGAKFDGSTTTNTTSTPTTYNGSATTTFARYMFMLGAGGHDGVVADVNLNNAGTNKIVGVLDFGEAFTDPATNLTEIDLVRTSGNRFPAGTRIVLSKPI